MPRTTASIERDFVEMLRASALGSEISGGVYRWDYRPRGSKAEDVCVKLASGELQQVQTGIISVAAFYSDIALSDGSSAPDPNRGAQLEDMLMLFPEQTRQSQYRIEAYGSPMHVEDPNTGQHFVSAKLKFKILTD